MPDLTNSVSLSRHTIPSVEEQDQEFDLWRIAPSVVQLHTPVAITEEAAVETVSRTLEVIKKIGFCLWNCNRFGGAVICIVQDPGTRVPQGYPVYTIDELWLLSDANQWTERMVLEAKRVAGAVVIEVRIGEGSVVPGEKA